MKSTSAQNDDNDIFVVGLQGYSDREYNGLLMLRHVGDYTYKTVAGSSRRIPRFELGEVATKAEYTEFFASLVPEPSAADKLAARTAAQTAAQRRKAAADVAIFKFHYDHAVAGDEASQRRLAELYEAGIGCEKDTNAAAAWLRAAATNSVK